MRRDGRAVLSYLRTLGGREIWHDYLIHLDESFGAIAGDYEVSVSSGATIFEAQRQLEREGRERPDHTGYLDYVKRYCEIHGTFWTIEAIMCRDAVGSRGTAQDPSIEEVIDAFCGLFFEMNASYRLNATDVEPGDRRMYPDTVHISPHYWFRAPTTLPKPRHAADFASG